MARIGIISFKTLIAQDDINQCFIAMKTLSFQVGKVSVLHEKYISNEERLRKDEIYFNIRNSIVRNLLFIIGQYEQLELSGLQKMKSKFVSNIDKELSSGYERLGDLLEENVSLSFIKWIRKNYNSLLITLLEFENLGEEIDLVSTFASIDIYPYLSSEKIDISREQFILNLNGYIQTQDGFFTMSLQRLSNQDKEKRILEEAINNALEKRNKLSSRNILSAVVGGFIYNLFQNILGPLIESIDEDDLDEE